MRVKFRTNLGSNDAHKLGIDHKQCADGMTCNVDERAGEWLVKQGIAIDVTPKPKAPEPPPASVVVESKAQPETPKAPEPPAKPKSHK